LQQQALLRIHLVGELWFDPEEAGVKEINIIQETTLLARNKVTSPPRRWDSNGLHAIH
jgi:hypothetical protein